MININVAWWSCKEINFNIPTAPKWLIHPLYAPSHPICFVPTLPLYRLCGMYYIFGYYIFGWVVATGNVITENVIMVWHFWIIDIEIRISCSMVLRNIFNQIVVKRWIINIKVVWWSCKTIKFNIPIAQNWFSFSTPRHIPSVLSKHFRYTGFVECITCSVITFSVGWS